VRGLSYMGVGHFSKKEFFKVVSLKARDDNSLTPFQSNFYYAKNRRLVSKV